MTAKEAQFRTEQWPLSRITPYASNPRLNDDAVRAVAESIRTFGFRQPIVVDTEGVIVCGHTRYKAAKHLGLETVPVHVAKDLTPEQIRAYRIADNKSSELAEWDLELLPIELGAIAADGIELSLLGFDTEELAKLLDPGVKQGLVDEDEVPAPPDEAVTQPGDLWLLGNHRLLCGDSSKPEELDRLIAGAPIHLVNTDPPYNVKVEPRSNNAIAAGLSSFQHATHHQKLDVERHPGKSKPTGKKVRAKDRPLANDFVTDEEFDRLLDAWFGNMARVLEPGRGFYCYGGYANLGNYPPFLRKHGLYFSQAIVWDKLHPVLTRKDFLGCFELCQPPDTKVVTSGGTSSIAALRNGDKVLAFSTAWPGMIGYRSGPEIQVGRRHYGGPLYGVNVGKRTTWCTDGHHFSVRLVPEAKRIWCVYLMRRGRWWRVGKSRILTTWGLGIKQRLEKERADEVWILATYPSNESATTAEQIASAKYGIPTTYWEQCQTSRRSPMEIARIYDSIDPMAMHRGALWALSDHGRRFEFPFVRNDETREKFGRRVSFRCNACNLLPEVMLVPIPAGGPKHDWEPIRHVDIQAYNGPVYSLNVEKYHHYVADGIVTHNCFYGWKEGAAHKFYGPNNVPDLWHVKKIPPQQMEHLTAKPAELAVRAMQYSSVAGENVLDLFGGSGSTLIAAEQTGRNAFLMELDTLYCDVIVDRFQRFTGKAAVLERTGESPIAMKPRESGMR